MKEELKIKNKLFLLVIFSAALGLLSTLTDSKIKKEKTADEPKIVKDKSNETSVNCSDDYKSELSVVLGNNKKINQESCLFVGCSGFNF